MDPSTLSRYLRRLAAEVESSGSPSRSGTAHGLGRALMAAGGPGPRQATLRPTIAPSDRFEVLGKDVPAMFHAGRALVTSVPDGFFDGWYGYGFYAAFDAEFVRRWYGPVVTQLRVKPDVTVLLASVTAELAPPGLFDVVMGNDLAFLLKGDEAKLAEHRALVTENPLQWVHAVDRLAIEKYSVVIYSDEQVVVKMPGDSVVIEGEVKPAA